MFYFYYTVTPRQIKSKSKPTKADYTKYYQSMLEYADGMNIQCTFPDLLSKLFRTGQICITAVGNSSSKTLNTLVLPNKFCKPTVQTQFGTNQLQFDFSFFDTLGFTTEQLDQLLSLFPDEFREKYEAYRTSPSDKRWQDMDPTFTTCIQQNDDGFPTFLAILYDIVDYKTYKLNELDRNTNLLERLVSQEIDMEKTGLDLEEVQALHDSMAEVICQSPGSNLVTTVGKLEVHPMQEDADVQSTVLQNAFDRVFDNAGFNHNIFTGSSSEALDASLKRDANYVWNFVQKLQNFYNIAINNVKSFGPYQCSLRILPINAYNRKEMLEELHQSATLGIGIIDYMVASGINQIDIEAELDLQEHLDLVNRLVPLQSSHTQSSSEENLKVGKETSNDAEKESVSKEESLQSKEDTTEKKDKSSDNKDEIKGDK